MADFEKRTSVRLFARDYVSQSLKVLLRQLHEETLASFPAPPIAINTADQPLAVMVDLDELVITLLASSKVGIISAR
jgi:hypothetical protein